MGEARPRVQTTGSASPAPRSAATERRVRALALQGQRAGFVSRLAADIIDAIVVVVAEFALIALVAVIRFLITRHFRMPGPPPWIAIGTFWVIAMAYLTSGWATSGKTLGKQVAGVRVVRAEGSRLGSGKAFVRAFLYLVFPAGVVWSLFSSRNASVQDLLLGTVVLYDWSYRALEGEAPA